MKKIIEEISNLGGSITQALKLAYEIDGPLVSLYYLTAFIGAVCPIIAAYLFKIILDNLVTTSNRNINQIEIPLLIIIALASYFFVRLVETVAYWGLNISYYDYLLRNKLQAGLNFRYAQKLASLDLANLENPTIQSLITTVDEL